MGGRAGDPGVASGVALLLGLTFPLFAVAYGRVAVGGLYLALPMVFLGLLLCARASAFMSGSFLRDSDQTIPWSLVVGAGASVLFLQWHAIGLTRAFDLAWALRETIKLAVGIVCFWGIVLLFPRRAAVFERLWTVALWASAALMALLIYKYAFVFKVPYLSVSLDEPSREDRNQLTWYFVFILPLAFAWWLDHASKLRSTLVLGVLIVAWIYAGSRGAWISAVAGILWVASTGPEPGWLLRLRSGLRWVLWGVVVAAVAGSVLVAVVGEEGLEAGRRLAALFDPDADPGSSSMRWRSSLAQSAWSAFLESPVTGIGLTNSGFLEGKVTHNDYVALLAEGGILSFGLFWLVLLAVAWRARVLPPTGDTAAEWWVARGCRGSMLGIIISLLAINAYTTLVFWAFLGLTVAAVAATEEAGFTRRTA